MEQTETTRLVRLNSILTYQDWLRVIQSYNVNTIRADLFTVHSEASIAIEINHEDQVPNDRVELNKISQDSCYYNTIKQKDLDNLLYRVY